MLFALLLVGALSAAEGTSLDEGQRLFYNARYQEAAAFALPLCMAEPADLAACELATSALHFQIKRALGDTKDPGKALPLCAACAALMTSFSEATTRGLAVARAKVVANPADDETKFLLGKLDLNFVWLQLGTLGRKTGWKEYWEARHSLDEVIARNPNLLRARVARAWIDYIVDTRMPRMTKWLLGGGNKKRGLEVVAEVANNPAAEPFVAAEAIFALWDMQVREKQIPAAILTARRLTKDFPDNPDLAKFLAANQAAN